MRNVFYQFACQTKMSYYTHFLLLVLFSLVFCSCIRKTTNGTIALEVSSNHISDWKDKLVFDECHALKGTDSIMLSSISKCLIDDEQIIIYDGKSRKIFAFRKDGQFIHQIGCEGRANSEYMNVKDIAFSSDHSLLYILDDLGIVVYDAQTGKFQEREEIKLPDPTNYRKLAVIASKHYLLFNPHEDGLGEIIEYRDGEWTDLRKAGFYQLDCGRFYTFKDKIRILPSYGDFKICSFNNESLAPFIDFEFEEGALPDELKPKSFREFLSVSEERRWFDCVLSACETSSWIYANVTGPKDKSYWIFGNKENSTVLSGPMPTEDGMQIIGSDEGCFYAIIHSELVSEDSYIQNVINGLGQSKENLFLVSFHVKG